jgi:murein DD-endopeptidase MepM/ murein hydrolase activator NlpD
VPELVSWNPEMTADSEYEPKPGRMVFLGEDASILDVKTVESETYNQAVSPSTIYTDTDTMYVGQEIEQSPGCDGVSKFTDDVTKIDGRESSRLNVTSQAIVPAVPRRVLRGTKPRGSTIGSGSLIYPVHGRLTSPFGPRWGSFHEGIDIGCPIGTPVAAADAGTVVFTGRSRARGKYIEIDHGNGMLTVYEHLSKVLAKDGDTVYQGETIADSGNTGDTTGPHLHFEVHIDGTPRNPLDFL